MNRIVHFEIHASEPEKLVAFYKEVFDWKIDKWDSKEMEYWMVSTGEKSELGINGGIMRRMGPKPENNAPVFGYVCTVQVKNIDETIQKIEKAGGTLALAKFEIAGMAWQAYYKDPDSNIFGIHEPIEGK